MFQAPRGTADVLPADQPYWQHVIRTAERLCARYGYQRIDTPTFEDAGVFIHGTGESSDIVQREMYLFDDRDGGRTYALRPEFTPNIMRAYLEHGLFNQPQPVKLWTVGPAFRYERPQAGRTRQFHQLDLEAIGEADPAIDAELIDYLWQLYAELGLRDLTVQLNSIGDQNCRPQYVQRLRDYYADKLDQVCKDDRLRFEKNPLRLLDCKVPTCQPVIAGAPTIAEHLCGPCAEHFARLQRYLVALRIRFVVQPRLVRGLDYYTRTVFEFVPEGAGSTGTIGAGGRYDGLMEVLGGEPTPGIGFATGIERIVLNLKKAAIEPPPLATPEVFVAYPTEAQRDQAVLLAAQLRHAGIGALVATGGRSLKAQMKHAGRTSARYAYIVGSGPGESQLRDLNARSQAAIEPEELVARLTAGA
ncbi:MAG TPA: histidine--tRNA ligase [Dehalococcoidia bacterium]|nr:histidine--tRNA ligase [Dehalococcoidia bacterium]